MSSRHQEASLYYYIEVLLKRKRMILLFVSVSITVIAVTTVMTPKAYRGKVMLYYKQDAIGGGLSLVDVKNIINDIYGNKREVFTGFSDAVTGLRAEIIGETRGKLYMTIEAKERRYIRPACQKAMEYVNGIILDLGNGTDNYRRRIRVKKELLEKEIEVLKRKEEYALMETGKIRAALTLLGDYGHLDIGSGINRGVPLNSLYAKRNNAPPVQRYYLDLVRDKFKSEEMLIEYKKKIEVLRSKLEEYKIGGLEPLVVVGSPVIDDRPVRPRIKETFILGGLVSVIMGVFLALLIEHIEGYPVRDNLLSAKK